MTSGGFEAIRSGLASSGRIVVVGAWAREVARRYQGEDLGVELVLTSPHPILGYRPLTYAPTLMGGEGTFPGTVDDLLEHADAYEVYGELRAQLERAILWGIGISHLSVLQNSVWPRADLADVVLELAEEFHLALRIASHYNEEQLGYDAYGLARKRGIITPSEVLTASSDQSPHLIDNLIGGLSKPRVIADSTTIELSATFAVPSPELHSYGTWGTQIIDVALFPRYRTQLATSLEQLALTMQTYRNLNAH
jgi:hypothetical protein